MAKNTFVLLIGFVMFMSCDQSSQSTPKQAKGPSLAITSEGVQLIQQNLGAVPIFDQSLLDVTNEVNEAITEGIDVPIPKDKAGGYTHARHKKNFLMMQKAGLLFQITKDETYARFIKDMLLQYAQMFPDLPLHPITDSYSRGKLFWQCLNDANWLVYTSQAYDCIRDWLNESDRKIIEGQLLRPYADFISLENPKFFNRLHNHSTWACAGIGMVGLAIGDEELVQRALYGLPVDENQAEELDDDGGVISVDGKAGFLAQIDELFSPDGFYAEGPYYQRYAMYPFMVFARSLENAKPELGIFKYREEVLKKAVYTLLNLTNSAGEFYPINDAQKGMSYYSKELVSAVDIIYYYAGQDPSLLSIAEMQGRVLLDEAGLAIAKGIKDGSSNKIERRSSLLVDGSKGEKGGLALVRSIDPNDEMELVFKYTSQGMGHGHYDKLSFLMNDGPEEIFQDYGVVRFVNIEQKQGGGYLPENKTYAKQTVAHNTLVVNETTNFGGKIKKANASQPYLYFSTLNESPIQIVSVKDTTSYPGVEMMRTLVMIEDLGLDKPIVLDLFKANSKSLNQYDLPYHYHGQLIQLNTELKREEFLNPLGKKNGYQHIWKEASGSTVAGGNTRFTWLSNAKFYTMTCVTTGDEEVILGRIGANDPAYNLRNDPVFMLRKKEAKNILFANLIESHGSYSPVSEMPTNLYSQIEKLSVLYDSASYTVLSIENKSNEIWELIIVNDNGSQDATHNLEVNKQLRTWTGVYNFYKTKKD